MVSLHMCLHVDLSACVHMCVYVCACLEATRAVGAKQGSMMKFRSNEVFAEHKCEGEN